MINSPKISAFTIENTAAKVVFEKLARYLAAVLLFILGIYASKKISERLQRRFSQAENIPPGFAKSAARATYYALVFIFAIFSLQLMGINVSGLLVAGGIIGIAVGFAAQTTVSNLLSGIFLYLDRPMDIGDAVELDDISGIVIDIAPISSKFRTWDGKLIRLPNETVFKSKITNYTKAAAMRIEFDIGISYESDLKRAMEVIKETLEEEPFVLINPKPEVYLNKFADSAIMLKVKFWAPRQKKYYLTTQMLEKIYHKLKEEGIEIPYPQLDVHIKEKG